MINKLYLRVYSLKIQGGKPLQSHILYRVDDIKEFGEIINSNSCKSYFTSVEGLLRLGKLTEIKPYQVTVTQELFNQMTKQINRKIGSERKLNTDSLNIVQSSRHHPCIVINKVENEYSKSSLEDILAKEISDTKV